MRRLREALLIAALCGASAASADTPPPPPAIPACDAPNGAASVERLYQTMTMSPFEKGVLKVGPVKDLGIFPPPPNPYASEQMFVKEVRYCEAEITLPDGAVDPTFWTVSLTFNIRNWLTPTAGCSLKHDVWRNGCAAYKPGR